ncbi:hypothetical protein KY331_02835 [Candidatus Woesearchaeota archaeon]|nr:hypothetical protein [Candidatus Woesearchaeota archaeon]
MYWKQGEQYAGLHQLIHKSIDTVYVGQDDFNSSDVRLLSEGFSRCNGIVFLDKDCQTGALAHISGATRPGDIVNGIRHHVTGARMPDVKKLEDIFQDCAKVKAINVYHSSYYAWWPEIIEEELAKKGVNDVQHVALTTRPNGEVYHRAIALDVRRALLYIFPNNRTSLITVPFFKE